ncbi:MAG: hypothetical protein GYB53_15665 [Rhodobacteraceae bacterium]|nr:hypothetical protein [Paracoccaceae bacterium]MBR9820309.1 hypothetical protein [Paracoccaceae bacterium]
MTRKSAVHPAGVSAAFLPAQAMVYGCMAGTSFWLAAFSVNMAVLRGMGFPATGPARPHHATPV